MLTLGIDTSADTIDVALLKDSNLLVEKRGCAPREHLTMLMPMIKEILEEASVSINALNLIAITTGPGAFTGIRLGLATAKTIAQLVKIPLAPVNTIDAVAAGCKEDGVIIPSLDARKNEIFYALYDKKGDEINRRGDYQRAKLEDYFELLNGSNLENPLITGSIFRRFTELFDEKVTIPHRKAEEKLWSPRGEVVARLGLKIADRGETVDYLHLKANYMREWETTKPKPLI